ncbi:glutathione S-transferase N-terminal domain-containing protein [Erythrobacter sp. Alg231-14]|uniref:glutathione S-transferase N-terminal domain-containing protein n=1 Tax=Erythrobacter sp. Alg231-14 TaxID=1922225 RepID=UPI000D55A8D2
MTSAEPIRLVGAAGSPYTQKMVAVLRYRRIPYAVTRAIPAEHCDALGIDKPKPIFEPTFFFDEHGEKKAMCDSTPIIRKLEALYPQRFILPSDPALAFIDYLIEDFADEWCTKYMFHYRWHFEADADNAGLLLPLMLDVSLADDVLKPRAAWVKDRQVSRLHVVGSNDTTAPLIDASYRRFLGAMDLHLANQKFMLGGRPGAGDFGLFGQLSQLVGFDPTPRAIAHTLSPRAVAWVELLRDQSGLEPSEEDWIGLDQQPESLRGILNEIGRMYAPAQLANARAVEAGNEHWEAQIDGATWSQRTFPYQAKCLRWTIEHYHSLDHAARASVDTLLDGTGVEAMLVVK